MRFDLASVAPRLALAHRQRRAELHRESLARRRAMAEVLRAEFAVAHCDLEVARAGAGGGRRAARRIAAASVRLDIAREQLAAAQARADELGVAA